MTSVFLNISHDKIFPFSFINYAKYGHTVVTIHLIKINTFLFSYVDEVILVKRFHKIMNKRTHLVKMIIREQELMLDTSFLIKKMKSKCTQKKEFT